MIVEWGSLFAYENGEWSPVTRSLGDEFGGNEERDTCMHTGASGEDLRLVSWNVWFSRCEMDRRSEELVEEILRLQADGIALQEMTYPCLLTLLEDDRIRDMYYCSDCGDASTIGGVRGYGVVWLITRDSKRVRLVADGVVAHIPFVSRMGRSLCVVPVVVSSQSNPNLSTRVLLGTAHLERYFPFF